MQPTDYKIALISVFMHQNKKEILEALHFKNIMRHAYLFSEKHAEKQLIVNFRPYFDDQEPNYRLNNDILAFFYILPITPNSVQRYIVHKIISKYAKM